MVNDISLIIFDFDGVLTDNKVWVSQDGTESVCCNRGDGLGFDMLRAAGVKSIILSTEINQVVSQRGSKLKVPVIQGVKDKGAEVRRICKEYSLESINVAYVGNDLNDITALNEVDHRWCPDDAADEVRNMCTHIFKSRGGSGVVREIAFFLGLKWTCPI
jgi:3-deoxy-D-manno-octulosonate 8-phosphate phosphatase (KDO 8-P phosphatase)